MKLKTNEKAAYREKLLEQQDGKCALCQEIINEGQATLDHDHGTGHCRMVLCRNCNSIEGRVLHWVKRTSIDSEKWLTNLMWYWNQDWSDNPVYPTHKNYIEKEISKLRKQKKKVKLQKTKRRYQEKIDRLLKQLRKEDQHAQKGKQAAKKGSNNNWTRKRSRRKPNT